MSQAVTLKPQTDWTPEQVDLVKKTVAKGATDDELKLFLHRCKIMGLDPLKPGQIHFIKYGTSPGTIVVGIDGFRSRANKTGVLSGISRGVIRDAKGHCIGAWAEVHRKDWTHPAREEVSLAEYNSGKSNWAKMPETMIKKVAEAAALRMAFPDDFGGIYAEEEMHQATPAVVAPEQPGEEDGVPHEAVWTVPGGGYVKRTISELMKNEGPSKLEAYVTRQEERFAKDPEKKPFWWDDFADRVVEAVGEFQSEKLE